MSLQFQFVRGSLYAVGEDIEGIVNNFDQAINKIVSQDQVANRRKRDGSNRHHITIFNKPEMMEMKKTKDQVFEIVEKVVSENQEENKPIALGLGSAQQLGDKAYFIILCWTIGREIRERLAMSSKDFHITVGFSGADVHGARKNVDKLEKTNQYLSQEYLAKELFNETTKNSTKLNQEEKLSIYEAIMRHSEFGTQGGNYALYCKALLARAKHYGGFLKDYQSAIVDTRMAIDLNPTPRAYLILGDCYKGIGQIDDAVEAWESGFKSCSKLEQRKIRETFLKRLAKEKSSRHAKAGIESSSRVTKFPRTSHIFNLGAATRDDLLFPKSKYPIFCSGEEYSIRIEEKIDGANLGIWFDKDWNAVTKNRSHFVCSETATQWTGLDVWLDQHRLTLCEILQQRFILYGEWMYAKHSIHYTKLPGLFIAFDLFDRLSNKFLSAKSRDRILRGSNIPIVPTISTGHLNAETIVQDLTRITDEHQSKFRDGGIEGLVVRCDEKENADDPNELTFQQDRAKLVRADFIQGIDDHWIRQGLVKNIVRRDLHPGQSQIGAATGIGTRTGTGTGAGVATIATRTKTSSKYPSTPHLPFSPCVQVDDIVMKDLVSAQGTFCQRRVIVTEKLDGGNCCLRDGKVFARTHSKEATHWSFGPVKSLYASLQLMHPEVFDSENQIELFGENMSAIHSILYDELCSPFYLFGVRKNGVWCSWDEVTEIAETLRLPTVPLVFDGKFENMNQIEQLMKGESLLNSRVSSELGGEGFVIRTAKGFSDDEFDRYIAKYVRPNHIQTKAGWKNEINKAPIKFTYDEGLELMKKRPPISNQKAQVFVDLDGTLADFDAKVMEIMGKKPDELPSSQMWRAIENHDGFFSSLDWMPKAKEMWDDHLAPLNPTILSGVPMSDSRWAQKQKLAWCARHLGPNVPVILCATRDKKEYSGRNKILIDDRGRTRRPWEEQGGTFIHHKSVDETLKALEEILSSKDDDDDDNDDDHKDTNAYSEDDGEGAGFASSNVCSSSISSSSSSSSKKKKKKKNKIQKPERPKKSKYKLIICVGFPGSGKSTFSEKMLKKSNMITRICQDELGSRSECENLVGKAIKRGAVILDRCNVQAKERERWMELAMVDKSQTCVVHFDFSSDECVNRVIGRQNHPTIQTENPQSAKRIISSFEKRFEAIDPTKFAKVFKIQSIEDVDEVVSKCFK